MSWSSLRLRAGGHGAAYTKSKGSASPEAWAGGWCQGTVVVAMDPLGRAREPLRTGILLAQQHSRRLAVLGLVRDPPHWMHCAPVATPWTWQSIKANNIDEAVQRCGVLVGRIPTDIPVSFALICGGTDKAVDELVAHDSSSKIVFAYGEFKSRRLRGWERSGIELFAV